MKTLLLPPLSLLSSWLVAVVVAVVVAVMVVAEVAAAMEAVEAVVVLPWRAQAMRKARSLASAAARRKMTLSRCPQVAGSVERSIEE